MAHFAMQLLWIVQHACATLASCLRFIHDMLYSMTCYIACCIGRSTIMTELLRRHSIKILDRFRGAVPYTSLENKACLCNVMSKQCVQAMCSSAVFKQCVQAMCSSNVSKHYCDTHTDRDHYEDTCRPLQT